MKTVLAPGAPWPTYDKPKEKEKAPPKPKVNPPTRVKKINKDPVCFIHLPIKTMSFCKEDMEFFNSLKNK